MVGLLVGFGGGCTNKSCSHSNGLFIHSFLRGKKKKESEEERKKEKYLEEHFQEGG